MLADSGGVSGRSNLVIVARTRSGLTSASRTALLNGVKPLEIEECPFCNLPETRAGRWGEGLAAEKMKDCRWLQPMLMGRFEFVNAG